VARRGTRLVVPAARRRLLQLGDESAPALGLAVPPARIGLILVGVVLSALTVAVTGPLSVVAFLAGPLARMIVGRPSFPVAAAVGALFVLLADLFGQGALLTTDHPDGASSGSHGTP